MGRKEVREFEKSKVVPYREVLPYSVAKVEFGEKGNLFVLSFADSLGSQTETCVFYIHGPPLHAKSKRCIRLVETWMKK